MRNQEDFAGCLRKSFAYYEIGGLRIERKCGNYVPAGLYLNDMHRAIKALEVGKWSSVNSTEYFEITSNDFIAAIFVGEVLEWPVPGDPNLDENRRPRFTHLVQSYWEFVGDERKYRNAISLALLQCA